MTSSTTTNPLVTLLTHEEADFIDAFNATAKAAYDNSRAHGFWDTLPRNRPEMLMLIVRELSEALEGLRDGSMDKHLPHRTSEEVEIADTVIRLMDYGSGLGLDVAGALVEKMRFNATREHKHGKRF